MKNIIILLIILGIPSIATGVILCDGLVSCVGGCDNYVEEFKCYITDPDADKIKWMKEQDCKELISGKEVILKDSKIPLCEDRIFCGGDCYNYIEEYKCYLKDPDSIMINEKDCAVKVK